ncbi:S-adenosyl-L-methionine-dependent methyltransferase [Colletotrichum phormii]|uniref:S-adenosyl-L-methionine-dependent methyltransferase n=1 Tax=Colletotrichum phormii TaxID=359342 RepID=A0AAJ0EJ67_9PEZI|nr:S-adenosyl-L-methionine-dependent methyltransferase [Colletotrichum phormii]KAK1638741.1 S-adenosyl-L-methionine-dependent methyltransferase [Colletotrichum phormii]
MSSTHGMNGTNGTKGGAVVDATIATRPNDLGAVPGLLKDLNDNIGSLSVDDHQARHELLLKARSIVQALEAPRETMIKHCWAQTGAIAGINLGTVKELADALGVDPALLSRLMRHLGAMGYIKETSLDETSCTGAGPLRFHEYSRKRGFENPTDDKDTPMMYAYNTDKDMFAWQQDLGYGTHFNHHMSGYRQGRHPWMAPGFFPVKERLIEGANTDADAPFLVDIGGSIGHDLAEFHSYYPKAPGKLILQDLPVFIGQIQELTPAITPMGHDFLTEQPVKGARAYYMHSCLHDWPDDVCETILKQIKAAMKPGYSKLLINENVIPSTGAWWETSALNMVMLTLFCSKERTEGDWYHLLEKIAGLKIVKIWGGGKGVESLIEVELP